MPPKKTTATNGDGAEGAGKFMWEGPNDSKLLLMTQGRYVKTDEYEQLSSAFPGTTVGSIRNRISALRVKQRNLYEENGWELPEGGAGHSAKKSKETPSKRGPDDGEEQETPTKKPRTPRAKKGKKVDEPKSDEGEPEGEVEVDVGVKEEVIEEMA